MKTYTNYYFVGAGGIGMAALERYFKSKGANVAGYDRTRTALTDALAAEGVEIVFDDDPNLIPKQFEPDNTLVVYTPAVPADNAIFTTLRSGGFTIFKRAQVLGMITEGSYGLCFSGTHGKTTTSSMAALILHESGVGCNAFLGGVLRNIGSNLILSATSPFSVIEADEYDRSFHHLRPYVAVVTATDPDHLDIYGTEEAYLESFAHFTELIRPDGAPIVHEGQTSDAVREKSSSTLSPPTMSSPTSTSECQSKSTSKTPSPPPPLAISPEGWATTTYAKPSATSKDRNAASNSGFAQPTTPSDGP